jgi:hypothetical protein
MQFDPTWHYWERLTKAEETKAEAAERSATAREDLVEIGRDALALGTEAVQLMKRIALGALLWGSAGGVALSKDHLADLIVVLLKGAK